METTWKSTEPRWVYSAVIFAIISALLGCGKHNPIRLPYDKFNPVVYDNDEAIDAYVDEYLLALASIAEIQLKGILTSSSVEP
jgi:predicted small lipoprotein YifL